MNTNTAVPEKPYFSPSRIDMTCRCGEQARRVYEEGERLPPGVAAMQGTAVHDGAAVNFRQKVETHQDLPRNDIVEAAVAKFESESAGMYVLTADEASRGVSAVLGDAKDQVASMAELLADEIAPDYQPVLVEQTVRIILPDATHDLLGILDLADDQNRVIDFKTSGKRKTQAEADQSVQLTFYGAGHRVIRGTLPDELRLEVMVKKATPERQIVRTHRGPEDFRALANRVNSVLKTVKTGLYTPAPPGSWYCSAKWCGFWSTCKFVNANPQRTYSIAPPKEPVNLEDLKTKLAAASGPRSVPKASGKTLKERVWNASGRNCHFCQKPVSLPVAAIAHVVLPAHGGSNDESNLCISHRVCNEQRADAGQPVNAAEAAGAK